jgi:hypothetical protein
MAQNQLFAGMELVAEAKLSSKKIMSFPKILGVVQKLETTEIGEPEIVNDSFA